MEGKVIRHDIVWFFVLGLYFKVGNACRGFYQASFMVTARVDKWYVSPYLPSQPHIFLYRCLRILVMVFLDDFSEWKFGQFWYEHMQKV